MNIQFLAGSFHYVWLQPESVILSFLGWLRTCVLKRDILLLNGWSSFFWMQSFSSHCLCSLRLAACLPDLIRSLVFCFRQGARRSSQESMTTCKLELKLHHSSFTYDVHQIISSPPHAAPICESIWNLLFWCHWVNVVMTDWLQLPVSKRDEYFMLYLIVLVLLMNIFAYNMYIVLGWLW